MILEPKKCNVCSVILTKINTYGKQTNRLCKTHLREYNNKRRGVMDRVLNKIQRMKYEAKNNKTAKRKQQMKESILRARKKYPVRYYARLKLHRKVKAGEIKKLPCIECGEVRVEGHHPDYTKPLDVIWYCHKHHCIAHNKFIEL